MVKSMSFFLIFLDVIDGETQVQVDGHVPMSLPRQIARKCAS